MTSSIARPSDFIMKTWRDFLRWCNYDLSRALTLETVPFLKIYESARFLDEDKLERDKLFLGLKDGI